MAVEPLTGGDAAVALLVVVVVVAAAAKAGSGCCNCCATVQDDPEGYRGTSWRAWGSMVARQRGWWLLCANKERPLPLQDS